MKPDMGAWPFAEAEEEVSASHSRGSISMKIKLLSMCLPPFLNACRRSRPRRSSIDVCHWEPRRAVGGSIVRFLKNQDSRATTYYIQECLIICRHDVKCNRGGHVLLVVPDSRYEAGKSDEACSKCRETRDQPQAFTFSPSSSVST